MALRPPRAAASVTRRLSERARTETVGPSGLEGIVDALHGLVERLSRAAEDTGDEATGQTRGVHGFSLGGSGVRAVFGYTLRMGLDGVAAEPFGDLPDRAETQAAPTGRQPTGHQPTGRQPPARQPIVEVVEEADAIVVIAELPGADPAGLVCRAQAARLLIEATGARRYRKQVDLPAEVKPEIIGQSFRNGILEVRLARAAAA